MLRTSVCILVTAVAIIGMCSTVDAQPPPAIDPDAKGDCAINQPVVNMNAVGFDVTGTRSTTAAAANAGWQNGAVTVIAYAAVGRRLVDVKASTNGANWNATFSNMPNGAYTFYALHTLEKFQAGQPQPVDKQIVVSKRVNTALNIPGNTKAKGIGASIWFGGGTPYRAGGDTEIRGEGGYTINVNYAFDPNVPFPIKLNAYPVDGGLIREAGALHGGGVWNNGKVYVNPTLKYDVFASILVRPDPMNPPPIADTAHILTSEWKLKQ